MIVGGIAPGQYYPLTSIVTHVPCWASVTVATQDWAGTAVADSSWAVLVPNSYNEYCLGENFMLIANEDYPLLAVEDRPLIVPADSGFSIP